MIKNYLKIALRNLRRQKAYAFINVFGLAAGMAVCLLIVLFIQKERSYDAFHDSADRIYRVHIASENGGQLSVSQNLPEPVVAQMYEDLPEVEAFVKTTGPYGEVLITANDQQRYEDAFVQASPSFFDVFSYHPIAGNLDTALDEPGSVVLTESAARTYFGEGDPLGQVLTVTAREETNYTVRAVIEDVPSNAHLQFNMVVHRPDQDQPRWNFYMVHGYVLLREDANLAVLEAKLPEFVERNAHYDRPRETLPSLLLQPLTAIHLHPEWGQAQTSMGPVQYLYLFGGVALLILIIACVNFMNLATARSATRAREVGVRKTVGAGRGQLIFQFLSESVLMSILALGLALVLVELLLPAFNALIGQDLDIHYGSEPVLLILGGIALLAGLFSGSYPAFFLSSFRPTRVLKGQMGSQTSGTGFRKTLVVFQFGASVALILATIIIYNQMAFIRTTRLNANDDQVLLIQQSHTLENRFAAFKEALVAQPAVMNVATGIVPGSMGGYMPYEDTTGTTHQLDFMSIGPDYLQTLGLGLAAGRDFVDADDTGQGLTIGSKDAEDRRPVILNETAVSVLGLEDPVGQFVPQVNGTVVGVVRDFHMRTMHETINPLIMQFDPDLSSNLLVRLEAGHIAEGLAQVQQVWQRLVPERPLLYAFLDDELDQAYRAELRLGSLFGAFAVLAVVIACLGLFGLAAFTAEQRTKEIGIRKVLGATITSLVALLSKDFVKLVAIAFVIAAPVAYLTMNRWLEDFAYRIDLSVWIFVLAGGAALGVALLTVSYQAIRAALTDPVKSLRYE